MREIKFKLWDKACNRMFFPDEKYPIKLHLSGLVSIDDSWATGESILLQFTGLKDKNGKEIYEGDIVKGYGCYEDEYQETIGQVQYKGDQYCLCDKKGDAIEWFDDGSHETYGLECWQFGDDEDEWEVIGNIYENPELLTSE